jgi:hypothetical protein
MELIETELFGREKGPFTDLSSALQAGKVDKTLSNKTGITGTHDFAIVYAPGSYMVYASGSLIVWDNRLGVCKPSSFAVSEWSATETATDTHERHSRR